MYSAASYYLLLNFLITSTTAISGFRYFRFRFYDSPFEYRTNGVYREKRNQDYLDARTRPKRKYAIKLNTIIFISVILIIHLETDN